MPYTIRLNLASYYKNQGGEFDNYSETGAVPVFNDDFEHVTDINFKGYYNIFSVILSKGFTKNIPDLKK